ncbi:MAG: membrane protein [Armatimonadota bacterium]|nr:MAG: membrane protein [Armatimonadota bacterium]
MSVPLHGIIAEFESAEDLLHAAQRARQAGYTRMDAYSPFPVHGLSEAIGFEDHKVPWVVFLAGVVGAIAGFSLQYYISVVDYPINVGGRPHLSWPSFIPVTFETTVLFAAFGAFIGMLALNGLPQPYHPVFNAPRFERASQDRFFLCIEANDPQFDRVKTRHFLENLGARLVSEVEE